MSTNVIGFTNVNSTTLPIFVFTPSVVEVTFAIPFVKSRVKVPVAGVTGVVAISKVNVFKPVTLIS